MTNLETRIQNTKTAIEKLVKKIERIELAMTTGKNPYYYDEADLRRANRELDEKKARLVELEEKQAAEERMLKIPAIETFLEEWKLKAIEWHKKDMERLQAYLKDRREQQKQFENWKLETYGYQYFRNMKEINAREKELGIDWETHKKYLKKHFSSFTLNLNEYGSEWETRLETMMENEKNAKRKILITRMVEVVGEITDAGWLTIGMNGEINGIIIGTQGKAKVETISAGGWNIQCFHYRVLVNKIKEGGK